MDSLFNKRKQALEQRRVDVAHLYFTVGMTYSEIARQVGCSEQTVANEIRQVWAEKDLFNTERMGQDAVIPEKYFGKFMCEYSDLKKDLASIDRTIAENELYLQTIQHGNQVQEHQ